MAAASVAASAAGVTLTNNAKDDHGGPGGSPGSPFSNGYHLMSPYNHYTLTPGPPQGPDQQSSTSMVSRLNYRLPRYINCYDL